MCGIAGIFAARISEDELVPLLDRMASALFHRGPDEAGSVVRSELRAGLTSQRLSIVDLATGRQPMRNEDGTVQVVFNGEIYNHADLRRKLTSRGHSFRSLCDTEVLVHGYEEWGLEALRRLHGMFAVAILDLRLRRLALARDPAGMKPVYWCQTDKGLLFASEIRALQASGHVEMRPDFEALRLFTDTGYVPAPLTGFAGVRKLAPGGVLVAGEQGVQESRFWTPVYPTHADGQTEVEYADELEHLLRAAVRSHLRADVPVGAFLSGGWDSSLVTTFAAEESSRRLRTYSIVFSEGSGVDERRYSRMLSERLETEHEEIEFVPDVGLESLRETIEQVEEPHARSPTLLISQLCRTAGKDLKSVLSGEGSDELFAGYRYYWSRSGRAARTLGPLIHPTLARAALAICPHRRIEPWLKWMAARPGADRDVGWLLHVGNAVPGRFLGTRLGEARPDRGVLLPPAETMESCREMLDRFLSLEQWGRLAEGILLQADKLSMAHSLEMRMPFLDRDVMEFSMRLPARFKLHRGREKLILKRLTRLLPEPIAQRRKWSLQYPMRFVDDLVRSDGGRDTLLGGSSELVNLRSVQSCFRRPEAAHPAVTRALFRLLYLQIWWDALIRR